jgi:lysophospholipid acyltransferase (LPLAT)-like uncharacterized protein
LNNFKTVLLAFLASWIIRFLRWSWRVEVKYIDSIAGDKPIVFCFWHGDQAGLFAFPHNKQLAVLSSLSKDGTLQAHILEKLGFAVARGSSSRGASVGLKKMILLVRSGCDAAYAVDGPKGPYRKAKEGAIETARQTSGWVVPIFAKAKRSWIFKKSWDRYTLPKPFTKVVINVGKPLLPEHTTAEMLTEKINELS